MVEAYRSLLVCTGSSADSGAGNATRSTLRRGCAAASASAQAGNEAIHSRRRMRAQLQCTLVQRALAQLRVDVDQVPPLLPEQRTPKAADPRMPHVVADTVHDGLVRCVGDGEHLGLAEQLEPLRAVGH